MAGSDQQLDFTPTADSAGSERRRLDRERRDRLRRRLPELPQRRHLTIGLRTDYTERIAAPASPPPRSPASTARSAPTPAAATAPRDDRRHPLPDRITTGCYRYTLTGTDRVGNAAAISTVVKVDTTPRRARPDASGSTAEALLPPAPLALLLQARAAAGAFNVTATAADAETGVPATPSRPWPARMHGRRTGATRTYTFIATPTGPRARR